MQVEKNHFEQEVESIQLQIKNTEKKMNNEINNLKNDKDKQIQQQQQKGNKILDEKEKEIQKLIYEIAHLQNDNDVSEREARVRIEEMN